MRNIAIYYTKSVIFHKGRDLKIVQMQKMRFYTLKINFNGFEILIVLKIQL